MEKASWNTLQTTLFEPFEILRHSNQQSYSKERENRESGRELRIWLPLPSHIPEERPVGSQTVSREQRSAERISNPNLAVSQNRRIANKGSDFTGLLGMQRLNPKPTGSAGDNANPCDSYPRKVL